MAEWLSGRVLVLKSKGRWIWWHCVMFLSKTIYPDCLTLKAPSIFAADDNFKFC